MWCGCGSITEGFKDLLVQVFVKVCTGTIGSAVEQFLLKPAVP